MGFTVRMAAGELGGLLGGILGSLLGGLFNFLDGGASRQGPDIYAQGGYGNPYDPSGAATLPEYVTPRSSDPGSLGESLGIPTNIPHGVWGIGAAFGLPSTSCDFGGCGAASNFQLGPGAVAGTVVCQFAELCGAIEDAVLVLGTIGVLGYDVYQMSRHRQDNAVPKRQFEEALRQIERRCGRPLSAGDRRRLHDDITKQGFSLGNIVEIGVGFFLPWQVMETREELTTSFLSRLVNLPAWGFRLGFSTFITVEFGQENLSFSSESGIVHGDWHLWVEMASWRFVLDGALLIGNDDENAKQLEVLELLTKGTQLRVNSASVGEEQPDLTINFSNGMILHVLITSSEAQDREWTLYSPNGSALTIYGDGHHTVGP